MYINSSYRTHLPKLGVKGLKFVTAKYTPINAPLAPLRYILESPYSLMMRKAEYDLSRKPLNTLWWMVRPLVKDQKAVVRNRIMTRMRQAVRDTLKEKGYDEQGRGLMGGKPALIGSLEIEVHNTKTALEKYTTIKRDAVLIVNDLECRAVNRQKEETEIEEMQKRIPLLHDSQGDTHPSVKSSKTTEANSSSMRFLRQAAARSCSPGHGSSGTIPVPQSRQAPNFSPSLRPKRQRIPLHSKEKTASTTRYGGQENPNEEHSKATETETDSPSMRLLQEAANQSLSRRRNPLQKARVPVRPSQIPPRPQERPTTSGGISPSLTPKEVASKSAKPLSWTIPSMKKVLTIRGEVNAQPKEASKAFIEPHRDYIPYRDLEKGTRPGE